MRVIVASILAVFFMHASYALPKGFVYLSDIDASILQDIRYASDHNFIGRPIHGYDAPRCILTKETAQALAKVQKELQPLSLSLKVYDCYRPVMAVQDFMAWSKDSKQQEMKAEFYPRVNKADFFRLGYVAEKSGHNRGSTVDLTLVTLPVVSQPAYHKGQPLLACTATYLQRYRDNSIDMGTGFDCMDILSHGLNRDVGDRAFKHRMMLRNLMIKHGFQPYEEEWWHFTLKNELYPNTYFNFPVK